MTGSTTDARLTERGILFTLTIDRVERNCFISKDALNRLSELKSIDASDADPMELFQAFSLTINGTARRLATGNVRTSVLELPPSVFEKPSSPCKSAPA